MHTIYVTPAGYTCTCGHTQTAVAGGQANRAATQHAEQHERVLSSLEVEDDQTECVIIDYRRMTEENARLTNQLSNNASLMQEASTLIQALKAHNQALQDQIDEARVMVERQMSKIYARIRY